MKLKSSFVCVQENFTFEHFFLPLNAGLSCIFQLDRLSLIYIAQFCFTTRLPEWLRMWITASRIDLKRTKRAISYIYGCWPWEIIELTTFGGLIGVFDCVVALVGRVNSSSSSFCTSFWRSIDLSSHSIS